jgi:hypothetical protein
MEEKIKCYIYTITNGLSDRDLIFSNLENCRSHWFFYAEEKYLYAKKSY